jgi:hypothetical protein
MAKVLNGDHGLRGQRLVQWEADRGKGKHTTEVKQSDSDARVHYVPCAKLRLEMAHRTMLRRTLTTLYHPASTELERKRGTCQSWLGEEGGMN